MIINRHNYEEFFILYMDNELSSADRSLVELFVEKHPDLKEELDMLMQSKLEFDPAIVFENKESLMKMNDYEESLLLYIDNELTTDQKAEIENHIANNPSAKKELELLKQTKLQPEVITFPDKESLYRKEEKVRPIIAIRWWQVAAAVLLLIGLTVGGIAFFRNNKTTIDKENIVRTQKDLVPSIKKENKPQLATVEDNKEEKVVVVPQVETDNIKKQTIKEVKEEKKEQPQLAVVDDEGNKNNLPELKRNIEGTPERTEIASNTHSKALTNSLQNNSPSFVTSPASQPFLLAKNDVPVDEEAGTEEPEKKSKFRGLLRKITRTFEKTTNIKATDEEDRLLVAGLAIRL